MGVIERKNISRLQTISLRKCTQTWWKGTVRTLSLHRYYPICGHHWRNSPSEEARRNVREQIQYIWDFKDGKDSAVNRAIMEVELTLKFFFTQEQLKELTFVCLPASNQETYEKRFQRFSHEICERTGMEDAFGHIIITGSGWPSHEGGGRSATFEVDSAFFERKYLLLFDDIITHGNSFRLWKQKLNPAPEKSAVIGGVFLARTWHTIKDGPDIFEQIKLGVYEDGKDY